MIKILIADDDPNILEMIAYNLSNNEGYEVYTAKDGVEAIELAKEHNPTLVILDIMMPKMDGVEVCEKLRSKNKFQNTLIVFLTARNEDFTQIACYESGGDDYIVKPIKPKVLASRIKAILRRYNAHSRTQSSLMVKDINIDLESYTVSKEGKEINLAKKEFELLVLLASKPGKLFTRDEIFNKVWGVDQAIGDRTIDVHVRKLREKIGTSYIKTIKGMGYKVEIN